MSSSTEPSAHFSTLRSSTVTVSTAATTGPTPGAVRSRAVSPGETPPAREVLAGSRTLKGGGAAGVAMVGAAGLEVAQQVLAGMQGAILPLVPYLDTLRWALYRARRHRARHLCADR